MKLYLMTTQDKYELPLAVADSVAELSKMSGTKAKTISEALCHRKNYKRKGQQKNHPKWHKIIIEED